MQALREHLAFGPPRAHTRAEALGGVVAGARRLHLRQLLDLLLDFLSVHDLHLLPLLMRIRDKGPQL